MAKSRFRLIAILPITPQYADDALLAKVKSIQKKTFGKGWMYFSDGYKLTDAEGFYNLENGPGTFYGYSLSIDDREDYDRELYDLDDLCISINAIVGANGSGKSSTVDLMLRILNNLAVSAMGETKNTEAAEHLYFIESVYGCLVYQIGGYFYQIQCCGRSVKMGKYEYSQDDGCWICGGMTELLDQATKDNKEAPIQRSGLAVSQLYELFYTAIFNYSLYAFNYQDYYEERTVENRWGDYKDDRLTQDKVWLNGLFHKNDGYQTPIVLNPMREDGYIKVRRENKLALERILIKLLNENDSAPGHAGQPSFPFRYVNEHLEVVALELSPIDNPSFSRENALITLGLSCNIALAKQFEFRRKQLQKLWCSAMNMVCCEETEEETLAWDYVFYKTLKVCQTYEHYSYITEDFVYKSRYRQRDLLKGLHKLLNDESHVTLKLRRALYFLKYNLYRQRDGKLVHLRDLYAHYKYWVDLYHGFNMHMEGGHLIAEVPEGWHQKDMPHLGIDSKTMHLVVNLPLSKDKPLPLFSVDKESGHLISRILSPEEAILPPIYDIRMLLIEKSKIKEDGTYDNKDLFSLEGLSSGEKQLIYSVSNLAYQVSNINSVGDNRNKIILDIRDEKEEKVGSYSLIRYKYVNLIMDEVELYFHPDLQRRYVKSITDALSNLNLKNIEGVNILMITHSPFILSDIPHSNILCLDNEGVQISRKTFGGNIHEMLGDTFFMESTIGALAQMHIMDFIAAYNETDETLRRATFESGYRKYKCLKEIIADDYLAGEIEDMYDELCEQYGVRP